eukprot:1990193-Rhodomonas_salina.1
MQTEPDALTRRQMCAQTETGIYGLTDDRHMPAAACDAVHLLNTRFKCPISVEPQRSRSRITTNAMTVHSICNPICRCHRKEAIG